MSRSSTRAYLPRRGSSPRTNRIPEPLVRLRVRVAIARKVQPTTIRADPPGKLVRRGVHLGNRGDRPKALGRRAPRRDPEIESSGAPFAVRRKEHSEPVIRQLFLE